MTRDSENLGSVCKFPSQSDWIFIQISLLFLLLDSTDKGRIVSQKNALISYENYQSKINTEDTGEEEDPNTSCTSNGAREL